MNSGTKVFDALKSRYRILSRPPYDTGRLDNHGEYLRQLWVFGNRELDDDRDRQHSPSPDSFSKLMVDLNIIDQQTIKEKIISALSALHFQGQHVLVQFWSPVVVRNRCSLTTLDQPFALGVVDDKGLYSYRLDSEQRMFVVDEKHREELGPPARVYRQKLSEWSFDSQTLPTRHYVQDLAAYYNIYGYLLLPVFEPDSGCCVGVLELVTSSSNYVDYASEVQKVSRALKEENLKSPNVFEDPMINVPDERRRHELDEIYVALKTICDTHNLPLAQTWSLTGNSSFVANSRKLEQSCNSFKKSCIGKICMSTGDHLPCYILDTSMLGFHKACTDQHQGKSRGVIGRSLSSCGSWFCQDVTQLTEDDYPLVPFARHIKNVCRVQLGIKSTIQEICAGPLNCNIECPPSPPITLLTASDVPRMSENIENEPSNFGAVGRSHSVVPYSEKGKGIPHRKRKRSESSISLEEIKKHLGKPVDEAAASLRVSRSTLKR
nr:hypothetical protein [Tanacetum cinerariifolium]